MLFMNEYDIEDAVYLAKRVEAPHLMQATATLERLADWANSNSDGWAYWPKPCRAAKRLQEAIQRFQWGYRSGDAVDTLDEIVAEALPAALRPIKAFLTKQGVDHSLIIR